MKAWGWEGDRGGGGDERGDMSIQSEGRLWWRSLTSRHVKRFPWESRYHYQPICLHIPTLIPCGYELVGQHWIRAGKSHKTIAMKVVSSLISYGQFTLISSDWLKSQKGFKPAAQQFPCAAALCDELLSTTAYTMYWFRCEGVCVILFSFSLENLSKLGENWNGRSRGQKILMHIFKLNLTVKSHYQCCICK